MEFIEFVQTFWEIFENLSIILWYGDNDVG